jgi:N-acetyl-anhydromuramyl-L-alanine amidase AmpD
MPMLPIDYLTIHCAATPEGRDVKPETVEQWDIARFGQKSYHWIIPLDGECHRSLDDHVLGCHTGGHNSHNIGICYVGGCDSVMRHAKDTRTPLQRQAMLHLVQDYIAKYPHIKILGHRNWAGVKKDCPSFDVRAWLESENLGSYYGGQQ